MKPLFTPRHPRHWQVALIHRLVFNHPRMIRPPTAHPKAASLHPRSAPFSPTLTPAPSRSQTGRSFLLTTILTLALTFTTPKTYSATNTASLHLYCLSVRLEKGQASLLSLMYYIEFSSFANWSAPNHEFYPLPTQPPPTHASSLFLTGDAFSGLGGLEGAMRITLPDDVDSNADGVADFYQVALPVAAPSNGEFQIYDPFDPEGLLDYGTVQASWQRAAHQHRGVCELTLAGYGPPSTTIIPANGLRFSHPFEILEYAGTLSYAPSTNTIHGTVSLTQVGNPSRTLTGPISLTHLPTDPDNGRHIQSNTWTNALNQNLLVSGGFLDRDPQYPLKYFGPLVFDDGDPSSPHETDYEFYSADIDDPNDFNSDGVPDLTDPPPNTITAPSLAILRSNGGLNLTVTGQPGQTLLIQASPNLVTPSWEDVNTLSLTNAHQTVSIPVPDGPTTFWRLLLQL